MRYFLGPWHWVESDEFTGFAPPRFSLGTIDLGTLPQMAVAGKDRPGCLCWTDAVALPSEYELLAEGDCREIKTSERLRSAFKSLIGYAPAGDALHEMILDCFIGGSDPEGLSAPKPIMPGIDGWMDLHLGGHGRVKGERFEWGITPHTDKISHMIRADFKQLKSDAESGKLNDDQQHLRILDAWCEKYRVTDWKEFVAPAEQKDVPGRVTHATTHSENFNGSDSGTMGTQLTWTEVVQAWENLSNAGKASTANGLMSTARAEHDVSSTDHETQVDVVTLGAARIGGPMARFASAANTGYTGYTNGAGATRIGKIVAGTLTALGSGTSQSLSLPDTFKIHCSGSTISQYFNGGSIESITDSSISSGTRGGLHGESGATAFTCDNWSVADVGSAGLLYTQLEGGTRGLNRGMYTRWGN